MGQEGGTMARGKNAAVGDTRVAQNGYHYTKTADRGWRLTHHITAEEHILHRPLQDGEIVQFTEKKYKREPYNPEGIRVIKQKTTTLRARKAKLEARIEDLQLELREVNKLLEEA
jgi:hypothetical protein